MEGAPDAQLELVTADTSHPDSRRPDDRKEQQCATGSGDRAMLASGADVVPGPLLATSPDASAFTLVRALDVST